MQKNFALLLLLVSVCLVAVILCSMPLAGADSAGSLGSFTMPNNGYVTALYANAYDPFSSGGYVSLLDGSTVIASVDFASIEWGSAKSISPVFVQAGHTYTLQISGLASPGSGTDASVTYTPYYLITVNSAYGSPTSSAYVQAGGSYTVSVTSPVSGGSGVQYVCIGYSIDGGGNTPGTSYTFTSIYAAHSITFNWQIQYQVTFSVSGLDSSATGTVATIDGVNVGYSGFTYSEWVASGSSSTFTYTSTVASSTSGKQFRLSSYVSSPQTITGPTSISGGYVTQYQLTTSTAYSTAIGSGWYDVGSTAYVYTVASSVYVGTNRYDFSSWSGSGSGSYTGSSATAMVTMNGPITEAANWVLGGSGITQYHLTVTSAYGTVLGGGYYDAGSTAYAGLSSGVVSGGTGIQYVFSSWSVGGTNYAQSSPIIMTSDITVTASWSTQYQLTVSSPYSTTSGAGWYNSGASAYAGVATNIVTDSTGTHTLLGWSGGATGSGLTSNAIVMSSAKTATAVWSNSGGGGGSSLNYTLTLHGPYYEDKSAASGETVACNLLYANNTIYQFSLNSSVGAVTTINISSSSPFVQLQWNASSVLNYTRIYRFINGIYSDDVYIFIPRSTQPSYVYTFGITDFYGMTNPYLECRVSPDGISNYVIERADLSEGGTVTFILTQYQMYSLSFVCAQGTYTQSFTASILGTPGQYPINLNVLAGNFPASNSTSSIYADANRLNSTTVSVTYNDPSSNTSYVYVKIYHIQGQTQITDYTANATGHTQVFVWQQADSATSYYVYIEASVGGVVHQWTLPAGATVSSTNPFLGLLDYLGKNESTLPYVYTGWPLGMTSAQIAQMVGALIVMLFLCIGSFRSAGACCVISWLIFGVLCVLGWFGAVSIYTIPEFALSGFVAILVMIDEGKQTVREA